MGDIDQLYQGLIVRHSQHPKNFHDLPDRTHSAIKNNPLCGDDIELQIRVADGIIIEAAFQGSACAICMASASMMTGAIGGSTAAGAMELYDHFSAMMAGDTETDDRSWLEHKYPDMLAFEGVRKFPVRVQCARLPWEALSSALDGGDSSE